MKLCKKKENSRSNLLQSYNTSKQQQSSLQNREKDETVGGFVSCLVNRTFFGTAILYKFIKPMLVAPVGFFNRRELYGGNLNAYVCVLCFDVFYDMDYRWTMEYGIQNR